MELFGKMELNSYLCRTKKERDGLRHQRYITQTGYRPLPKFAKKETLRIIPQQFLVRQYDTVQLTYPFKSCVQPLWLLATFTFLPIYIYIAAMIHSVKVLTVFQSCIV